LAKEKGGSRITSGMTRKEPRWTVAFLRALERTGQARAAAEDAGIDHTTAYNRRKAHGDFAAAWGEALKANAARVAEEQAEELERLKAMKPAPPPPSHASAGEELVRAGGQVRRAGHGRWSARKEKRFFDELAATANIHRSAEAAGVSYNAVHQRRLRDPHFGAKWDAVREIARASIDMCMLEEAKKSFDPNKALDTVDVQPPRVTMDQAIKISQSGVPRTQRTALPNPFQQPADVTSEEQLGAMREALLRKLMRLRERGWCEMIAQGWTYDERHDQIVPPGWALSGG
jgi:hypothetical protein